MDNEGERLVGFHTGFVQEVDTRNSVSSTFVEGLARGSGDCTHSVTNNRGHTADGFLNRSEGDGRSRIHRRRHLHDRHKHLFNTGSTGVLAQILGAIDVTLDVIREELAETSVSNLAVDGRRLEVNLTTRNGEFVELSSSVGKKLEVRSGHTANLRSNNSLHTAKHVAVDNILFDGASELESTRLQDFLSEGFDVVEIVPDVGFDGRIFILHPCSELDFIDGVRISDDTIGNGTSVNKVSVDFCAVLFTLEFGLRVLLFGSTNKRHIVTDSRGKHFELLLVDKISGCWSCHSKNLLLKLWLSQFV